MSKWVSVEKELPAKYFDVLLFVGYPVNEPIIGYRHENGFIIFIGLDDEKLCEFPITHWTLLPNDPEGE